MVTILLSFIFYRSKKYRQFAPSYKYVKLGLAKNVMGKGLQFFVITIAMLMSVQIINVAISRELSPLDVTRFNLSFKYFSVIYMGMELIVSPFWSAFTDAYQKKDYQWMTGSMKKLETIWLLSVVAALIMVLVANPFYSIWVGNDVHIHLTTTISIALYVSLFNLGQIYMYMINGVGTVAIQLIIYLTFALIAWPLMVFSCRWFGLPGIVIIPSVVVLLQALFGKTQIGKIISGSSTVLWSR